MISFSAVACLAQDVTSILIYKSFGMSTGGGALVSPGVDGINSNAPDTPAYDKKKKKLFDSYVHTSLILKRCHINLLCH